MDAGTDTESPERGPEWFVDNAETLFGIDRTLLTRVVSEAGKRGVPPHEVARQKRVLSSAQADILATLYAPRAALSDYEFESVLGQGAMGVVYRARQLGLDRPVAIKTILLDKASNEARFEVEARTIARLRHPNIMTAFDLQTRDERLYLILELLDGENLEDYMSRRRELPEDFVWHVIRQAANALDYAESENIVHRDIKPANLFLVPPSPGYSLPPGIPMVKVTDFGLAGLIERDLGQTQLTQEGRILGTPVYMAPEQLGDPKVDHRADLYSLGATAYHMLSGAPPFAGLSFTKLLTYKASAEHPPLDPHENKVSAQSASLVAELLRREPDDRLSSYAELLQRIDDVLADVSGVHSQTAGRKTDVHTMATLDGKLQLAKATSSGRTTRSWLHVAVVPTVGVIILALVALLVGTLGNRSPTHETAMRRTGDGSSLFDGRTIAGWRTYGGGLNPIIDGEGGSALEVTNEARRSLPGYDWFEFNVGIDLSNSKRMTFLLSNTRSVAVAVSVSAEQLVVVRYDIDAGATANPRILGELPLEEDPWRTASAQTPIYRHLRITAEPGRCEVSFHSDSSIVVPGQIGLKPVELVLISEGPTRLETLRIDELKVADAPAAK